MWTGFCNTCCYYTAFFLCSVSKSPNLYSYYALVNSDKILTFFLLVEFEMCRKYISAPFQETKNPQTLKMKEKKHDSTPKNPPPPPKYPMASP